MDGIRNGSIRKRYRNNKVILERVDTSILKMTENKEEMDRYREGALEEKRFGRQASKENVPG